MSTGIPESDCLGRTCLTLGPVIGGSGADDSDNFLGRSTSIFVFAIDGREVGGDSARSDSADLLRAATGISESDCLGRTCSTLGLVIGGSGAGDSDSSVSDRLGKTCSTLEPAILGRSGAGDLDSSVSDRLD